LWEEEEEEKEEEEEEEEISMEEERERERGGFLRGGISRGFNKSGTLISAGNARRGTKWLWDRIFQTSVRP
jgi:hypothetical protein